jgi:hypothetical protein
LLASLAMHSRELRADSPTLVFDLLAFDPNGTLRVLAKASEPEGKIPAERVDADDMGVLNSSHRARLSEEAGTRVGIAAHALRDEFDSGAAAENDILGEIYPAHSTLAQKADQAIPGNGREPTHCG